jgi:hypothetical protein
MCRFESLQCDGSGESESEWKKEGEDLKRKRVMEDETVEE